mmetsp:Transcript_21725/g.54651  ORF Transcript_21725/g.54651 Transcript_21725/m.54651 type:complete len:299 (-) Transcript_21725:689-1585(-)
MKSLCHFFESLLPLFRELYHGGLFLLFGFFALLRLVLFLGGILLELCLDDLIMRGSSLGRVLALKLFHARNNVVSQKLRTQATQGILFAHVVWITRSEAVQIHQVHAAVRSTNTLDIQRGIQLDNLAVLATNFVEFEIEMIGQLGNLFVERGISGSVLTIDRSIQNIASIGLMQDTRDDTLSDHATATIVNHHRAQRMKSFDVALIGQVHTTQVIVDGQTSATITALVLKGATCIAHIAVEHVAVDEHVHLLGLLGVDGGHVALDDVLHTANSLSHEFAVHLVAVAVARHTVGQSFMR